MLSLCSSTFWKEASWVMVPSVSVSRHGLVIPFLDCTLFTTLAVRRNCLIWSLVRVGSSEAITKGRQARHATTARISPRQRRRSTFIEDTPAEPVELYSFASHWTTKIGRLK